jgi:exosome complex RNA-binding protein Rrp42 (RNase PH superfamily)
VTGADIFVDIYCLDYDGNIFDASLIALLACLRDGTPMSLSSFFFFFCFASPLSLSAKLPSVRVTENDDVEVVPDGKGTRLRVEHYPIPSTFALLQE